MSLESRDAWVSKGLSLLHPITIERGENEFLFDERGRRYLDFTSGIGVTNLGHTNSELVEAVKIQLEKLWHACFMIVNYQPYVELAEKLVKISPGKAEKQVFLANSGAEAVENAIKIARQQVSRLYIVAYENSFHGRTYLAVTLTGKYEPYKMGFEPFNLGIELVPFPYCYRCPFKQEYGGCDLACLDYVKNFFFRTRVPANRIAAFIIEPIQGEGGFIPAPIDYLKELKKLCEENGILLIVDEIQTGFGRTGKMFATEHYGVEPDLMTIGKAVANGLPLSGVIGRKDIMSKVAPGSIGGTFGGNPVACAAAIKVIDIMLRDKIPERAAGLGERMKKRLEEMKERYEIIGDVRGLGVMQAIELVKNRGTKEAATEATGEVIKRARERGLLLLKAGLFSNVVRLHPPLMISEKMLDSGLDILEGCIKEVSPQI
jgi:4-aminobutyrate aminotransferase/(S)-3-amino-2-methylpropionate transaminase